MCLQPTLQVQRPSPAWGPGRNQQQAFLALWLLTVIPWDVQCLPSRLAVTSNCSWWCPRGGYSELYKPVSICTPQPHLSAPEVPQGTFRHHQNHLSRDRLRRLPWPSWPINRKVACSNFSHHACFYLLIVCMENYDSLQLETCFNLFLLDSFLLTVFLFYFLNFRDTAL